MARAVWLITGIPGAGKATVARQPAGRCRRSAPVEGDALHLWVEGGRVLPGEGPAGEASRQIWLCVRHRCPPARSFAGTEFTPVVHYAMAGRGILAAYRERLADLDLRLVVLAPGVETALRRDRERQQKTVAARWMHLEAEMAAALGGLGCRPDLSARTPAETVAAILRRRTRVRLGGGPP